VKQSTNDAILVVGLLGGLLLIGVAAAAGGAALLNKKIFPANDSRVILSVYGPSLAHTVELQALFGLGATVAPNADGTYGIFVGPQDVVVTLPSWARIL